MSSTEATVAADWWADHLAVDSDTGDAFNDAFLESARAKLPKVTERQREAFRAALAAAIEEQIVGGDSWQEAVGKGDPRWGIAFRHIGVDYDPDAVLGGALEAAGVHNGVLSPVPTKTHMHIGPGLVTVKSGYGADWVDIWTADGGNPS